jgi:dGTPase
MAPKARFDRQHSITAKIDQRDPGPRDRDRVIYTHALRRLAAVTQVVGPTEGQIFHNRLTHTLEVAQVARRIAEKLLSEQPEIAKELGGIDPDVVETAALIHDLGHPPFGHIAEKELDVLAIECGEPDGFEGNAQSFRIVTRLAAHDDNYKGLNLTRASLNAVLKYPWLRGRSGKKRQKYGAYRSERSEFEFARALSKPGTQSVEAAIMDYADGVAYSVHDLDDFFRAGLISLDHLKSSRTAFDEFLGEWIASGKVDGKTLTPNRRDGLFNLLRDSFYLTKPYTGTFSERVAMRKMTSGLISQYIYAVKLTNTHSPNGLFVEASKELEMKFLQRIVWQYVISNPKLATQQHGQRRIIRELFDVYLTAVRDRNIDLIPALFHEEVVQLGSPGYGRTAKRGEVRLTVDVIASFNDAQATAMYRRLMGISSGSVADLLEG